PRDYRPFSFFSLLRPPPRPTLFPYTTLFRSRARGLSRLRRRGQRVVAAPAARAYGTHAPARDRRGDRRGGARLADAAADTLRPRSEEHTSELQSRENLVCRLLLEKKKDKKMT